MSLLAGLVVVLIVITLVAVVVYDRTRSSRSDRFEDHKDEHMEAFTEQRIRRNLNQGG